METNARPNIAGLVVGGLFAAPLAVLLCRKLPAGTLISALSAHDLYRALIA